MPAGTLPITHVKNDELEFEDIFNDKYSKCLNENLKGSEGMPMGI